MARGELATETGPKRAKKGYEPDDLVQNLKWAKCREVLAERGVPAKKGVLAGMLAKLLFLIFPMKVPFQAPLPTLRPAPPLSQAPLPALLRMWPGWPRDTLPSSGS